MTDDEAEVLFADLEADPLLRREAGEGWHPEGLNRTLLAAIVAREMYAIEFVEEGRHWPDDESVLAEPYKAQVTAVNVLKHTLGIEIPPSKPLTDDEESNS